MKCMITKNVLIQKVLPSESRELLQIGSQTFYDAFGPPVNTEKNIQKYLKETFTLEQINKELSNPNSLFYFARIQDQIVGYLKLNFKNAQTESIEGDSMEIERIYVIKELQRKNIGQILLSTSIETAKKRKVNYVWLGVWEKNPSAIRFYERNGFKSFDKHQFMLGMEMQYDIMMKFEI